MATENFCVVTRLIERVAERVTVVADRCEARARDSEDHTLSAAFAAEARELRECAKQLTGRVK